MQLLSEIRVVLCVETVPSNFIVVLTSQKKNTKNLYKL